MNMTKSDFKTKLKDWFVIQKIRLLNFIKEHKYTSAFIGIFLFSCIVVLIVYAADNDEYNGKVSVVDGQVTQKNVSSSEDTPVVNSFSTLVYDISYGLSISDLSKEETIIRDKVIIEAEFDKNIDADWIIQDEEATYKLSESETKKTLTATIYQVKVGEINSKQLYLKVKNVPNGTEIKTSIKVYESTSKSDMFSAEKTVGVRSEKVNLTTKIVSGTAYKSSDYTDGRLAPFGILVGFEKVNLNSLEGLYFEPNLSLVLEATQSFDNQNYQQIEIENENNKYFGLYDKSSNLLPTMPHYVYDYQRYSVYNSGKVTSLVKSKEGVSGTLIEKQNPDLYLIGDKTINLEVGEEYTEYGVATTLNGTAICKTSNSSCTRTIIDENEVEITSDKDITKSIGNYTISYEYQTENGSTKVKRNIKVSDKTTATLNEDIYTLKGNKNITLLKGTAYKENGIEKNGNTFKDYTSVIKINDEVIAEIDGKTIGTYTITYTINNDSLTESGAGETSEEETSDDGSSSESITLTRTINVIESLPYLKAQTLVANSIYAPSDGSFDNPTIYIDGAGIQCLKENNCKVEYYNPVTQVKTEIDKTKAGTYNAVYKVVDKNGFELQTSNTINIQTKYDFKIEGIKSDGNFYLYDNFVVLGSYFVNAKSPRAAGITSNIYVNLNVNNEIVDSSKTSVVNEYYSTGTKTNKLTFNTDSTGTLIELNESDYLSYGEEVVLKSVFNYSGDGDENINKLTTLIPIGIASSTSENPTAAFTMTEYSSNLESKEPYYISEELQDRVTVNYFACKMGQASTSCVSGTEVTYNTFEELNEALSKNDELKLAYLTYTLSDVAPGTEIDFRVRLVTNVGNQAGNVSLTSTSTFAEKQEDGIMQNKSVSSNKSINITAFKARTKVFIGNSEQDVIINGANVNNSTWTIYPNISLPAELVNTNVAGIDELKYIKIVVTLPAGINYLYNENYDIPTISNNGKTLTYILKGKHVNEWIDPITFETNYDIDIPSGSKKEIKVLIEAESTSGISDSSSLELRTTTRTITYQNNESISYAQYTPYTSISKETSFSINTKLYNNVNETHSNLDIVTLLPYNNVGNSSYTGIYTISDLPAGALCTTSLSSLIENSETLLSSEGITWEDCSKYKDNNYGGVTAIRVNGISLSSAESYEQSIKINPIGNKTDDSYKVYSYLIKNNEEKEKRLKTMSTTVTVISKRINGTVWEDFDANGIMDTTEKKISGVTLKLYDATTDELIKTTTSDEKGKYSLSDLDPGTYYVVAEYNTAKYGISKCQVSLDKSISSSFFTGESCSESKNTQNELDKENIDIDNGFCEGDECTNSSDGVTDEIENIIPVLRTENIEITNNTKVVNDVNLGLALRKTYSVKLTKYVTKAITTNNFGVSTIKDYGNVTLAKLDVKDINNLSIKVVYTLELENTGYYPGYIYAVKDYIPDGMEFNENYEENKGWTMTEYGYLENNTLFDQLVSSGEKKYLTIAFDVVRKEAGSFVNYASVDDDDLQILVVAGNEEGDVNE